MGGGRTTEACPKRQKRLQGLQRLLHIGKRGERESQRGEGKDRETGADTAAPRPSLPPECSLPPLEPAPISITAPSILPHGRSNSPFSEAAGVLKLHFPPAPFIILRFPFSSD